MQLPLVNASARYPRARLLEPSTHGYIIVAADVQAPSRPGPQLSLGSRRAPVLRRLKVLSRQLDQLEGVEGSAVFRAVAFAPPTAYARNRASVPIARFDVAVLVETSSPAAALEVKGTGAFENVVDAVEERARRIHVFAAGNAKRIRDVDRSGGGLFLFNYFVADDPAVAQELWEYLAGWYQVETGLDNSILLVPLEGESSDYVALNHARWDLSIPRFLARQLPKRSFRTYVQGNLERHRVGAMPVLYRLA